MTDESTYRAALVKLRTILGPTVPKCCDCQGCRVEWEMALKLLEEVLNDDGSESIV